MRDYDRYQLKLHDKAAGLIKEWCEVVGFLRFEEGGAKIQGDKAINKARPRLAHRPPDHAPEPHRGLGTPRAVSLPAEIELDRTHRGRRSATRATRPTTRPTPRSAPPSAPSWLGSERATSGSGRPGTAAQILAALEHPATDRPTLDRILSGLRASEPTTTSTES